MDGDNSYITIFVKYYAGDENKLISVRVHPDITVGDFKKKIKDITGKAICEQKFFGTISSGVIGYDDNANISSAGLFDMSTIYLESSRNSKLFNYIKSVSVMNLFGRENQIYKLSTIIPGKQYYYTIFPMITSPVKFIKINLCKNNHAGSERSSSDYMPIIDNIMVDDIIEVNVDDVKYDVKILSVNKSKTSLEIIIVLDKIIIEGIIKLRINANKKIGISSDEEYFFKDCIETVCHVGSKVSKVLCCICLGPSKAYKSTIIPNKTVNIIAANNNVTNNNSKDYFIICKKCNNCVCVECMFTMYNNPNADLFCPRCGYEFM